MKNKGKVPKRRFRGMNGDWEQRRLFDCLDNIIDFRGRTPKKLGMDWSESGYLALSALNVKDGFIDFNQDVHYGDKVLYDRWMTGKELHKGQVLFTTEAPMGNVAQVPDDKKYILSQRTIAFEVKNDVITENFLSTVLRSPKVQYDLNALASGGTAKGVSQKSLETIEFLIPYGLDEQSQIAEIFAAVERLTKLHQCKLEKLQNLKKAYLSEMFPKPGEKTPRRRFAGFTGDWVQRKLGDISEIRTGPFGSVLHAEDYVSSGTPIVTTEHFKSGALPIGKEDLPQVSDADYQRLSSYKLGSGDIVFSRVGSVDINALVEKEQDGWLFSGRVLRVRPQGTINGRYLHYLLETRSVKDDIISRAVGQTMPSINTEILNATEIKMANSEDEQNKIGEYFASLDNLITLHQRKLAKLQALKKAYLTEMFP